MKIFTLRLVLFTSLPLVAALARRTKASKLAGAFSSRYRKPFEVFARADGDLLLHISAFGIAAQAFGNRHISPAVSAECMRRHMRGQQHIIEAVEIMFRALIRPATVGVGLGIGDIDGIAIPVSSAAPPMRFDCSASNSASSSITSPRAH